jgi:hypothetical protein
MRHVFPVLAVLFLLVLASGCVRNRSDIPNETTEYEYYNTSGNWTPPIPRGDFTFTILRGNEFWLSPNGSTEFYVVFNNVDGDGETHEFVAKVLPSAVDFEVHAAYKCIHFTNCSQLHYDMNSWINQTGAQTSVNYTHVGLQGIGISISGSAEKGTYMYDVVACKDLGFNRCDRSSANWGPTLPLTIHVY